MSEFNDINQSTQEIQDSIDAINNEVNEFIDAASDLVADIYDPTRIQMRVIEATKKKLQRKRVDWKCTDFGLSSLRKLSTACQAMLSSSAVDVSASPLSSLFLSTGLQEETQPDIVIPVETETADQIDDDIDIDIPITPTHRQPKVTQAQLLERLRKDK